MFPTVEFIATKQQRFRIRIMDTFRDPVSRVVTRTAVDLSTLTDLQLEWSLEGVDQTPIALQKADQVAEPGWCFHDWTVGQLSPGEISGRVTWTDSSSRDQATKQRFTGVVKGADV